MAYGDRKSGRVDFERGIPVYMMGIDGLLSSLPSSEVVSSEEFHTSHRHRPELSGRRLSDAQPPFGPLQKRSTAPTNLWDHLQDRDTRSNQLRSSSEGSRHEPSRCCFRYRSSIVRSPSAARSFCTRSRSFVASLGLSFNRA